MKVLVTGGAGLLGKTTTELLVRHGWEVRVIGLETGVTLEGAEFVNCDIMDFDALREQMRGCDVVAHLAAIRGPQLAIGSKVFAINTSGTFNVFEAAAAVGIRRVVQASSINAFGCAYNLTDVFPQYFPIDEDHPVVTTDPYSFSKDTAENIGRYFWRRDGISSVALRFPWIYPPHAFDERYKGWRQAGAELLDELVAMPKKARDARLAEARTYTLEHRKTRPLEFSEVTGMPKPRQDPWPDPLWHVYESDRFNFWAFVDARDAAQSVEKGLTADYDESHPLFINDSQNWLQYDTETLIRLFYPKLRASKIKVSGSEALVNISKARTLIGFEPEYSVTTLAK